MPADPAKRLSRLERSAHGYTPHLQAARIDRKGAPSAARPDVHDPTLRRIGAFRSEASLGTLNKPVYRQHMLVATCPPSRAEPTAEPLG